MTTKTYKIISAVVTIAIIISIAILVYVNLPKQTETNEENPPDQNTNPTILTIIYSDEYRNFTWGEIERLEAYTAKGGYRTQTGSVKGLGNYTGVNMTMLVNMFQPAPYQYSLEAYDVNGESTFYNFSTINGHVTIYNPENGSELGTGNLTMVLAYQYEGTWLDESDDGKLKIVFLDKQGSITQSSLWWKKVISIRIITE